MCVGGGGLGQMVTSFICGSCFVKTVKEILSKLLHLFRNVENETKVVLKNPSLLLRILLHLLRHFVICVLDTLAHKRNNKNHLLMLYER